MSAQWRDGIIELLPRLRRFAFTLTGAPHDADDLLQSTVEKALSRRHQFKPGTNLDRWMFRICKNLWIDEWRARKVRGPVADSTDAVLEPWFDGDEVMAHKIALAEVNTAMGALSDDQRLVISLVGVEGFSYKEAAGVLNIPIGTVMSRLARARAALSESLEQSRGAFPAAGATGTTQGDQA